MEKILNKGGIQMKAIKRILIFIVTVTLLLNTACSSNEQSDSKNNTTQKKLSIWYLDSDKRTKYNIQKFRDIYPDIEISETVYNLEIFQDMLTKLSTELMVGEGPDIILFHKLYFGSLNRALESGVFTDLNALIKKDKEFNENEYYQKIFDVGNYNGKRLYIPLNYTIPYFTTTEATLKKYNINIEKSGITLEGLSELAKSFTQSNEKSKNLIACNFHFTDMMYISKLEFIDKKNKKSNFNTKEFIKLLEQYKNIYPSIATYEDQSKYQYYADMTAADKLVFGYDTIISPPMKLRYFNSTYISAVGDKMEIIPIVNKGVYSAEPMEFVGINENCNNKEAAFEIIKFMLSKDRQKEKDSNSVGNLNTYMPVNKLAFKEDMQAALENSDTGFTFPIVQLPESIADKMNMMIENSQPVQLIDTNIIRIVNKELGNYINGKASAEQTAKAIDEKVTILLNE